MRDQLQKIFGDRFKQDEPLSKHLNFRIGGPAKYFVEAKTVEEIKAVLDLAKENNVKIFVLGGGSNVLASDKGFDGLIIKLANRELKIDGTTVTADAGVLSGLMARKTVEAGLAGFEWAITLPGTIGGAVRGNAGCFGGETKDHFVSAQVYRDGKVVTLIKDELDFHYRHSSIKDKGGIVLSATFELEHGDKEVLVARMNEIILKRKATQPTHAGSAGCLFKNYEIKKDDDLSRVQKERKIPQSMIDKGQISSGWFIDKVMGLNGMKIGGAQISEEHGNFVINSESATADDIMQLIAYVQTRARDRFGIDLKEEVEYMG